MAHKEDTASMIEAPKRSITIHDESSKQKLFKDIKGATGKQDLFQSSRPKIQRVPGMLRDHEKFKKYYEPRAIAIGPFHHNNARCKLAEKFKLALAAKFIEESGSSDEALHKIIEDSIDTLKDCYDEEATRPYTDEALTDMLFLDGCSTLQFIYSFTEEKLAIFNIERDQVAFAEQDLFLLENQLPYQVLKLLMSLSNKKEELKTAIYDFVREKRHKQKKPCQPAGDAVIDMNEPTHLLELLLTEMLGRPPEPVSKRRPPKDRRQSFRNIQELKAAGIRVKPSKTSTLRDISFTSLGFVGFLSLPQISVDDSMGPKFFNLIAYEMYPDFQNDYGVTSYICFLDSLIDNAEDVKQLRSAGVLYNLLESDEELADLLNEICTDLVPNRYIYSRVKDEVEHHFKATWKIRMATWMVEFCHDHFSSPWTILALLGVLAALALSGAQTWYTISSPTSPCDAVCNYLKKQLKIE